MEKVVEDISISLAGEQQELDKARGIFMLALYSTLAGRSLLMLLAAIYSPAVV